MKKHLLSAAVGIALTTVSFTSNAEDLAQIYRLAVDNDPTLLRAAAERNAAQKASISLSQGSCHRLTASLTTVTVAQSSFNQVPVLTILTQMAGRLAFL